MLSASIFGLVASSALVIGAVAGAYWTPPRPLLAAALAFASGALITALAFDLFQESFNHGGAWFSSIGLLLGAAAFVVADEALDRYIKGVGSGVSALALLAAVTLARVPWRGRGDAPAGPLQTLRYRGLECHRDHTRRRGGARQRGPL